VKPKNGLIGFANIVVDDCLFLGSIGIHKKLNQNGYRITYPSKKVSECNLQIFHPIRKQISEAIEKSIINKAKQIFE
jgi:stage V sporulation protein G